MIDLRENALPNAIVADGKAFLINTDFRNWIRFNYDYYNTDSDDIDISYLFVDEAPIITIDVLQQLLMFLHNPSSTPKKEKQNDEKILDYVEDGEYIFSALYATYGIDITEINMHWHKFQALCNNIIGESTLWGYAKAMRGYNKPSEQDTYEKNCLKQKEAWSFPVQLTNEQLEAIQAFENYFQD